MNWHEREVGSYPENSIVGDSKDTKESTVPVFKEEGKERPGTRGDLLQPAPKDYKPG